MMNEWRPIPGGRKRLVVRPGHDGMDRELFSIEVRIRAGMVELRTE
jgi:hypothetical protein